jgi:hypothetical protein
METVTWSQSVYVIVTPEGVGVGEGLAVMVVLGEGVADVVLVVLGESVGEALAVLLVLGDGVADVVLVVLGEDVGEVVGDALLVGEGVGDGGPSSVLCLLLFHPPCKLRAAMSRTARTAGAPTSQNRSARLVRRRVTARIELLS